MDISIIVCTFRRPDSLRRTLLSVIEQTPLPSCDVEIIIVDNDEFRSAAPIFNEVKEKSKTYFLRYTHEPQQGVAHARNRGLTAAKGTILLWVDDDICAPSNWLADMARPLLTGEADGVAGKVRLAEEVDKPWMEPFHRTALASTEAIEDGQIKSIISASMGFRRGVLQQVPSFDTELGAGALGASEDVLFSWQLQEAGCTIQFVDSVCAMHFPNVNRLSRQAFLDLAEARGRSLAYIRYHWMHRSESHWTHREKTPRWQRFLRNAHIVHAKRYLDWKRVCMGPEPSKGKKPINKCEYWTTLNYASIAQFMIERNRERNYDYRGLVKRK